MLKGFSSDYNYAAMIDPEGNICFEPKECSLGTSLDGATTWRKLEEIITDNALMQITKDNQTNYWDKNGEIVLTINTGTSLNRMNEGFIFSENEYCYYDIDGNRYYTVTEK